MNSKQKIVNEINSFDQKIMKIVFDVAYISKNFDLEKVAFLKFRKIIRKKIEKFKHRFSTMKMYLMKENKKVFIFAVKTKNKNVTIFRTKINDERTFAFVVMKKVND